MKICEERFGMLSNGEEVKLFTLTAGDLKFSLTNFGAAWTSLIVPSRDKKDDVLLGYSGLDGFLNNGQFLGVTVGRFANRIKDASFNLNGRTYQLEATDGINNLHSGPKGFDKLLWKAESFKKKDGVFVRFELDSPDGDCGFPGNLNTVVTYGLTKSNELICEYFAKSDKPTPVNLTNHAYFNLAGEGRGDILSHEVTLYASSYVEVDKNCIPTGSILPVKDTVFDFTVSKEIIKDFDRKHQGYDHCFVTDGEPGVLRPCAEVFEKKSGRIMEVSTTQPGVQFYTGNHLVDVAGKQGSRYVKYSGFCLETQHFPDSPNRENFPSCITGPGNDYNEKAVFSFFVN